MTSVRETISPRLAAAGERRLKWRFLAAMMVLMPGIVHAADASNGEALAKRWCAACHIVSADQTPGADNVPPFATIAKKPGFSADKIAQFLMDPHPKMPDMQLTRTEARDLGAYIASLTE